MATITNNKVNGQNGHEVVEHDDEQPDQVMMTPLKKEMDSTILRVERLPPTEATEGGGGDRHVAGGQHQGIIINKQLASLDSPRGPCDLRLSFKVFLVNAITQIHQQELRELRFWFDNSVASAKALSPSKLSNGNSSDTYMARMQCAQAFFRALVNATDFPKSYVAFITKLMKTMQNRVYRPLVQIELEVRLLDEPFNRPSSSNNSLSLDENAAPQALPLTEERVLEMIESSYPNPLSLNDIANATRSAEAEVFELVEDLVNKGVARFADVPGGGGHQHQHQHQQTSSLMVVRVTSDERQVKRVRQMPQVVRSQQPTIAIITAQFSEKLAVDAMIDNKDTYVRYKVEGESNVYTLGNVGAHRVVATKLPAVGNSRSAMIAAGNTTTRLLGIFQHVEYVFLIGIGGGVPHYTDHRQHVRLGDIVVSTSPRVSLPSSPVNQSRLSVNRPSQSDYIYVHCERLKSSPPGGVESSPWKDNATVNNFSYRFWCPLSFELQDIAKKIHQEALANVDEQPVWEQYLEQAKEKLQQSDDLEFVRPDSSTDKLYMSIGPNDLIEMQHPAPEGNANQEDEDDPRARGMPKVHFGAIGSGRMAVGDERLRQDIAIKYGIKAFDIEFDTVIESIYGNRKDRYIIIRGIADYKDGARKKEWQPYAALSAAAYMKAILCRLEPMSS